jgi:hypothetical protein
MQSPEDPSKVIEQAAAQPQEPVAPVEEAGAEAVGQLGDNGEKGDIEPVAPVAAEEPYETEPEPAEPFTPPSKEQAFVPPGLRPLTKPIEGEEPTLSDCISILRESTEVVREALKQNAAVMERMIETETQLANTLSRTHETIPDNMGNPHLRLLLGALTHVVAEEDQRQASLHREGSLWSQTVELDGKHISGGIPVQRLAADGKYSLEELKSYVTRKAGVGGTVDIPLWHSGLWLRFKAPSLIALTNMNQAVADVKVKIGNETRGLAFSNISHFIKTIVVDFALQYVVHANVSFTTPTDLKPMIDTRDIPAVILGLAATLYPGGYPYANPCIADLGKCDHITKELYQVVNMWWVDLNGLTQWQKRHMSFRIDARAPRTLEDLKTYKEHHTLGREELIRVGAMGFLIGSPDAFQHEELGRTWLNGIIEMSQGAFNEPPEGRNRSAFIEQLAESTAAREYAHWVRAIVDIDETTPEGYVVLSTDKEFIAETLSDVFSADELVEEFNTKVEAYIDRNMIAMPAIVSYNCPVCHSPAAVKFKQRFENLIPIDPLAEFFTLASRKLSRILS